MILGILLLLLAVFLLSPRLAKLFLAWSLFEVAFEYANNLKRAALVFFGLVILYLYVALASLVYGLVLIVGAI